MREEIAEILSPQKHWKRGATPELRASWPTRSRLLSAAVRLTALLLAAACSESTAPSADPPVFSQQGSKLVGTGAVGSALMGGAVSLSADGNTALVGGYFDNAGAGAVWVWTRSGGVWTQQGSKLVGTGAVGAANQGHSVSLSADGNTAIVGGPDDDQVPGPCGSGHEVEVFGPSRDPSWSAPAAWGLPFRAIPCPSPPTAIPPWSEGTSTMGAVGPCGSGHGAEVLGPSRDPSWSARHRRGRRAGYFRVPLCRRQHGLGRRA